MPAAPVSPVESLNERDAREWVRLMRRGDFAGAWRTSDRIHSRCALFGDPRQPRHLQQIWDGRPLAGRDVLVRCYHGLGDTIQFVRFVPHLQKVARRVTVWAQPVLLPLLETLAPPVALQALHDGAPDVDYEVDIEVMELPYAFRTTIETVPRSVPYLHVSPLPWPRQRHLRAGLVWRAGDWNAGRSIPFEQLEPLLAVRDVHWYGLQIDRAAGEDHERLRPVDAGTPLKTASLMRTLDLVVSVDTMSAHLAGALGSRVWLLLPADADWRWMDARDDSPWYPTMRIFRQRTAGDWAGVVAAVASELARVRPA